MIKNLSWFVLLLTIWTFFSFVSLEGFEAEEEDENRLEMIANEMQQEFEMTRDPNTGTVPRERLMLAKKYADKLQKEISEGKERNAIPNFTWEERGPSNVAGRTRAILVDANDMSNETVFAGSVSGGLWKTTNFSAEKPNWTPVDDFWGNLAVSCIAQDPSNPLNIYVGTGEGWSNADAVRGLGIWKSSDGGYTWAQLGSTNISAFYYVMKIAIATNGDVYAATKDGLYRSKDGGATFPQVYNASGGYVTDIELTSSKMYLGHRGNGIYMSSTGDVGSWTKLTTGLPAAGFLRIEMAFAPNDPLRLYAMFESSSTRSCLGIYRTSDAGANWAAVTNAGTGPINFANGQAWYNFSIAVDPTNKETVWIGGIHLWRTLNGGTNWTVMSSNATVHADHHVILYNPNNADNIYFGNDGGVYVTENAKATTPSFKEKNRNYNVTQFYSCAIHPTAGKDWFIAGAQDNGTQLFESPKIAPTKTITTGDGAFVHIHRDTPNVQMSAYIYSQYFFTRDSWGTQTTRTISTRRGSFINPSDFDYRSNYLYAGYEAGKMTTIKVDGIKNGPLVLTIDTPTVATFGTAKVTAVTVSPNTTNMVFMGLNNGDVVKITNAHLSGRVVSTIRAVAGAISVSCIAVEKGNDNHIIVTYSNYGITSIYETQNGGASWTNIENNLPDMPIRWAIFNPSDANQVVIATELGVWSTDNLNGTLTHWAPSNGGLANVRTNMLKYRDSDNLLIAATHGRGLFSSDVFAAPTAAFTAENPVLYAGKAVQFVNNSLKDTQWTWNFGDGTTDNTENPSHIYAHPGYYNVNLTINNGASSKTINSLIHVLPYMGTPYIASAGGDFESIGQFEPVTTFGELVYTTFERGSPNAGAKFGTASGANAWATSGLNTNYQSNSTAMLYTPCFSFLVSGVYTIKFKARFNMQTGYDGFQVQYSLDKGDTWSLLGAYDPTSWYNYNNLGTAFPSNEPIFSGLAALPGNAFTDFSYATSALAGNSFVSFRFVFKSDAATVSNGVVIDDFEIDGPLNTPLPVDITEFSGDYKDSKVILTWHTNSETNCKGFEVQRSLDGESFEILGWRDGNGSTGKPNNYSFNDDDIRAATQYYRLKQVDFDGSYEYSDIIQVFIFPENEANMYVYPNPFDKEVTIRMFEPIRTSERLRAKIIDKNGVVLASIPITDAPPIKQIELDLSPYRLASGIYYLELYEKGTRIGSTKIVRK